MRGSIDELELEVLGNLNVLDLIKSGSEFVFSFDFPSWTEPVLATSVSHSSCASCVQNISQIGNTAAGNIQNLEGHSPISLSESSTVERLVGMERGEPGGELNAEFPKTRFIRRWNLRMHSRFFVIISFGTVKEFREGDTMTRSVPVHRKRKRAGNFGISDLVGTGGGSKQADYVYDDESTADILLHLTWTSPCHNLAASTSDAGTVNETFSQQIHLHAQVLRKSRYFEARLSERWQEWRSKEKEPVDSGQDYIDEPVLIKMTVAPARDVESYITTFCLLYSYDFANEIVDIQKALTILPVAAELLFDDCISACVTFLEAVPWNPVEEQQIFRIVSDLQLEGGSNLLARLGPPSENAVEEMLSGLVHSATHSNQKVPSVGASVKTFVGLILSDHASRDTVRLVLDKAFATSLKIVKDSVEEYSNPNVRGLDDEIEALQRQNLYTAAVNARSLLWLIERMIELRVAKTAVEEWSKQDNLTANLKRALSEDLWRNVAPGLPGAVLRCTCRLASAVANGSIITSRQVRLKLVNDWLPVLVVSRDNQRSTTQIKQLHQELEDVFLKIISTLPMPDAQKLLQQCLCFATTSVEDCSHLVSAFNTWFRRASHDPFPALEKDEVFQEDS